MPKELKILVVDDDKEFCQNVRDILVELKNYQVMTAYDGFKALKLVKQNGFDLVLMDVVMPGMDVVETFQKIREVAPDTPVIMITAYAEEKLIREALRKGVFGYLKKPLDFGRLFSFIENAIPNGARVLVVDDDEDLCANMKDILNDKGCRASVAYDGNTAIGKVCEENFDVIMLDMKLPPLNGLETYLAIRNIRPNVVVIIITGYLQEMGNLVEQTLQKGAYVLLEKPIDMDDLVLLLEQTKQQKGKEG